MFAGWAGADGLDEAAIKQIKLAHIVLGIKIAGKAEIGILLVDYTGKVCAGFGAAHSREDVDR
jgi:hypothetical protein